MDTKQPLTAFYENYDEDGRLLTRCGRIEYLTTMHYIQAFLQPGMRIVEIGAATGRYSHALARQGYTVDAVELMAHHIAQFRANTQPGEAVTIRQGDARDLSFFPDNTYDITLLLGPMYHLFGDDDKMQALNEAVRITKPGGTIFVAYCGNDATILQFCFLKGMLLDPKYRALVDPVTFKANSDPSEIFELHRPEEIAALRSRLPVTPRLLVATDGFSRYIHQELEAMDDFLYEQFIAYHLATCERTDMLGYSNHYLDIFQKEEAL